MPELTQAQKEELACTYAALILHDENIAITGDKINALVKAAGITVAPYWPSLFERVLKANNIEALINNVGAGGAAPAAPAAGGAAPAAAAAAPKAATAPAAAPAKAAEPAKAPMLFAELNKGGAITSALKKVDRKDTNKDKQISGKVEAKETKVVAKAPAKPPKVELVGTKWTVEYHVHPAAPVVLKGVEKNHSVSIYKCEGAVIQIEGKLNSVSIDSCKKTGLVFDELVSICEVINCQSVQVQVKHKCPSIAIDKTAGIQIYLSATSLGTEIVSGTSSEMNVQIPNPSGKAEDDPVEMPIPEQFKSVIKNGKLVSSQVDHSGG